MANSILTQARLKELLHYDHETGVFTWLVTKNNRKAKVGNELRSVGCGGYLRVSIDHKRYLLHRLAWFYVHGSFPENQIDHINRIRSDNRICNLRLATDSENRQNMSISQKNTSGHTGVTFYKRDQTWQAQIFLNYKNHFLGRFKTIESAIEARKNAKANLHKFTN